MIYIFYAFLGLAPSIIWLLFYLRKDKHPESNSMVIKVFIWGMIIAPLAVIFELSARWLIHPQGLSDFIFSLSVRDQYHLISVVVFASIIEELLKYAVVKYRVLKNPEFDEPLDAMLYMIIAALGFAAIENLLLVYQQPILPLDAIAKLLTLRFVSATFVHTLSSGMIGYWLAKSIREPAKRFQMLFKGFALAIIFHSGYNYLIWLIGEKKTAFSSLLPTIIIFTIISIIAVIVSYQFLILKKLHSVCKICLPRQNAQTKKSLAEHIHQV